MTKYIYSLVRCVPEPRTGEFVNVGAIVGRPDGRDWAVRRVSSDKRALRLGGAEPMAAVHAFLARLEEQLDLQQELDAADFGLDQSWLAQLHQDHRNVIQLTPPAPLVAEDAETGLDILFGRLIIDPVSQARGYVTKSGVVAGVRDAYREAEIDASLLHKGAELLVGDRLHTAVDLAVANGVAYQLTQAWSFQRAAAGVGEVATQVKAWGYAIGRLRSGESSRLLAANDHVSQVSDQVDIQVAIALPRSSDQERVYSEAQEVFADLGVEVHALDDVLAIGQRAAALLPLEFVNRA